MSNKGVKDFLLKARQWFKLFDGIQGSPVSASSRHAAVDKTSRDLPINPDVFKHIYRDPKNHKAMWDTGAPQSEIIKYIIFKKSKFFEFQPMRF